MDKYSNKQTLYLNEYFIAIWDNLQCHNIYYKMALGHIYTNNLPLVLAPFTTIFKTHLLKMTV